MFSLILSLSLFSQAQEVPPMWPAHGSFQVPEQLGSEDVALIISIEDYLYVRDFRGAKENGQDWKRWFLESHGVSPERLFYLEDGEATKKNIEKTWKKVTKSLGKKGRLWFVFLGYGSSFKEEALLITADTPLKKNAVRKNAWAWKNVHSLLKKQKDVEVIAIMDSCFSGTTPEDESLNIETETLPAQALSYERMSLLFSNKMDGCLGEMPRLRRQPFSYLALGALRGWGDVDFDGQVTMQEMLGYVNKVFETVAPSRPRDSIIISEEPNMVWSKATEEGPDLEEIQWILYPEKKEKRGRNYLPWDKTNNTGDFDDRLADLEERRKMEYTKESERNQKASAVREKAERHWDKVADFVDQAVDDYSKMAAYAFLDTYKSAQVQVQQQELEINIEEVAQAEKMILGMELPTLQDAPTPFVWVPSGGFQMGSPITEVDRFPEEKQHPVRITRSFYMSTTEITQGLYESVMNENPSALLDPELPVNQISWYDTIRFANRLSLKEGLETCYIINGKQVSWPKEAECEGYRLPTESEWEYAARGNAPGKYAGGDSIEKVAWYEANSSNRIQPAAGKEANILGLYDMSGNVWEWVWDGYGAYPTEEAIDPTGEDLSAYRIRRGGSAGHMSRYSRSAYRIRVTPSFQSNELGFRIVRTALLPEGEIPDDEDPAKEISSSGASSEASSPQEPTP
jgi:formylglycine-generating enzyme required for sulfatase activity